MANVRLPAELWREVFLQAAYVPGLLTTQWDYDPDDQPWRGWEFVEDVSIDRKRAIVQVCREWQVLGIEFLYEVIQIPRYRARGDYYQLKGLIDTLRISSNDSAEEVGPSLGYGWWVKRIDCSYEILLRGNETYLTSILHLVHNLSIFTIGQGKASQARLQPSLALLKSRFSHSLRRLDIKVHDHDTPHAAIPSIPVVSLDMMLVSFSQFDFCPSSPPLTTVTSLTLSVTSNFTDYPQSLYFPKLQHLGLTNIRDHDFQPLKPLIALHSSVLTSLYLQTMGVCTQIHLFLALAANLRTLTIDNIDFIYLCNGASSFPGITHIGIVSFGETLSDHFTESLEELVDAKMFPGLKLLQLLDQSGPVPFKKGWVDAMEKCEKVGLRLEDSRGQELQLRKADPPGKRRKRGRKT